MPLMKRLLPVLCGNTSFNARKKEKREARADMAEMARDEALRKVEKLSAEGDKLREA